MKFEVVRLGLTCACMNYNAREARVLVGSGGIHPPPPPPRNILVSSLLKSSLMRFLSSNVAETCCELAIVYAAP